MIYFFLIFMFFLLIISFFIRNDYFNIQFIYLYFICYLQDIKLKIPDNQEEMKYFLINSDEKGCLVEKYVARNAWYPLLSVESEDGEIWIKLKKKTIEYLDKCDTKKLNKLTKHYCELMCQEKKIITSYEISEIVANIFYTFIFNKKLSKKNAELLVKSSYEWRKELSIKGKGCLKIKKKVIQFFKDELFTDDIIDISALAQPFFISPMINISDIMVEYYLNPEDNLIDILQKKHPFPLLERKLNNVQCAFFLNKKNNKIIWGYGNRKCLGIKLAISILDSMIAYFKTYPKNLFQPYINHKYSGRYNDNQFSINELYYQIKFFLKLPFIINNNK